MATETLTCQTCGNNWGRERVRGRKPKECPPCKAGTTPVPDGDTVIYKSASNPGKITDDNHVLEPQVIDPKTGKRDPGKYNGEIDIEIPDSATESSPTAYLRVYDQLLINGDLYKVGDEVKIYKDAANGCKYKIQQFVVPVGDFPMYVGMVGVRGSYEGKWRAIDPWRISK